jgi:ceramide glucosyltransferase
MWFEWLVLIPGFAALVYQAMSLMASVLFVEKRRLRYNRPVLSPMPPVSILKPVRGLDDKLLDALKSHLDLDYPEYEVLLGIHSREDPAWPVLEQLVREHPGKPVRLVLSSTVTLNAKVGVLIDLANQARHPVWLMNDADISVPRDYLRRVTAPLCQPETGLVTCLYRAEAASWAGRFEALVISTDFIPSTLVAPLVGVREFGLGSTLCFRAEDLKCAGGFEALGDYIADDYQLAKSITSAGKRATFSEVVVDTTLSDPGWKDVWRHQVRWARTIRGARPDGFAGLPVTHAGVWAIVCAAAGEWPMALALWAARSMAGVAGGFLVLRHWPALLLAPLLPLCDLWSFAVWTAAWAGRRVWWRNRIYVLEAGGRIRRNQPAGSTGKQQVGIAEGQEEAAHDRE